MGRGMPRPYSKSNPIVQRMLAANEARKLGKRRGSTVAACRDPIIQVTFNIGNITAAMGRGMPRPYSKSNPIVQRMLVANKARKLGKRRRSTVAACRDPIIQVTSTSKNITAARSRGMPRPYNNCGAMSQATLSKRYSPLPAFPTSRGD